MSTVQKLQLDEFRSLQASWDALAGAADPGHPFATHAWLVNWLAAFGEAEHRVTVAHRGEALVGGFASALEGATLSPLEQHTYRSAPLAQGPDGLTELLSRFAQAGIREVRLHERQAPEVRKALERAAANEFLVLEKDPWVMRRIAVAAELEGFLAGRDAKVRSELRRKYRRFAEKFPSAALRVVHRDERDVASGLVEQVERDSWKFEAGSAIANSPRELQFYRGVLGLPETSGRPMVFALLDGDVPLATMIGLRYGRTFYALKTSYKEEHAPLSPGLVLLCRVLSHLGGEGQVSTVELLGRDSRWKREVATESETYCVYQLMRRDTAARLYAFARARVRPLLHDVLGRRSGV